MKKLFLAFLMLFLLSGCNSKSKRDLKNSQNTTPKNQKLGEIVIPESGNVLPEMVENQTISNTDIIDQPDNVTITLKIVGIRDGDSADGLYGDFPVGIRLAHIDAPEKRQAFGKAAKQKLSDLCFGKTVTIVSEGKKGTYHGGRIIAEVFLEDGTNVNKTMISEGFAWHYKKYSKDKSYDALENDARINKRGLWTDQNPVSPWNFR